MPCNSTGGGGSGNVQALAAQPQAQTITSQPVTAPQAQAQSGSVQIPSGYTFLDNDAKKKAYTDAYNSTAGQAFTQQNVDKLMSSITQRLNSGYGITNFDEYEWLGKLDGMTPVGAKLLDTFTSGGHSLANEATKTSDGWRIKYGAYNGSGFTTVYSDSHLSYLGNMFQNNNGNAAPNWKIVH